MECQCYLRDHVREFCLLSEGKVFRELKQKNTKMRDGEREDQRFAESALQCKIRPLLVPA